MNGITDVDPSSIVPHPSSLIDPFVSRTQGRYSSASARRPRVSWILERWSPIFTTSPFIAKTTKTKLSETDTMSYRLSGEATAWNAPLTISALVLKASNKSSASSTHVMSQISLLRTLIFFVTLSENPLMAMLSASTTTAVCCSNFSIRDAASENGTESSFVTEEISLNHASRAFRSFSLQMAKMVGRL